MEKQPTYPILQLPPHFNLKEILQEQLLVNSFWGVLPSCYNEDIFEELDEMLEESEN